MIFKRSRQIVNLALLESLILPMGSLQTPLIRHWIPVFASEVSPALVCVASWSLSVMLIWGGLSEQRVWADFCCLLARTIVAMLARAAHIIGLFLVTAAVLRCASATPSITTVAGSYQKPQAVAKNAAGTTAFVVRGAGH